VTRSHEKFVTGVFFSIMGVIILLAAFGLGPMSDSAMHAPRWIVGIAGMLFLGCGVMLIETFHRLASLMAGLATVGMTVICGWIALFGEDQYFSGGPSMFAEHTEVLIARVIFGLVTALGAAITINALRKLIAKGDA
jgi:hypothetical protein